MIKKFMILIIKGKQRKTHAAKGAGTSNTAWCGAKFKRTRIKEKIKLTIEHVTCQKCINTINGNLKSIIEE